MGRGEGREMEREGSLRARAEGDGTPRLHQGVPLLLLPGTNKQTKAVAAPRQLGRK